MLVPKWVGPQTLITSSFFVHYTRYFVGLEMKKTPSVTHIDVDFASVLDDVLSGQQSEHRFADLDVHN